VVKKMFDMLAAADQKSLLELSGALQKGLLNVASLDKAALTKVTAQGTTTEALPATVQSALRAARDSAIESYVKAAGADTLALVKGTLNH